MNKQIKKMIFYIALYIPPLALSIPIINNACCVSYGYGSNMNKCCFQFNNVEECDINSFKLGGVSEIYNNTCSYVMKHIYPNQ